MAAEHVPRFTTELVAEAMTDTPVVAVNGARQVGKSTLVDAYAASVGHATAVTLDDRTQFDAARIDPHTFVERDGLLVIDEVQRVPDLLAAIKAEVDRDRRPGRFLLTGSTRLLSTPEMGDSLAGRVEILDLWPLSQGELHGRREGFIDALFAGAPTLRLDADLRRGDYLELACAGGFPEPLARSNRRRTAWFDNYATTVVERMVTEVADIDRLTMMPRLLQLCAARTANELNVQDISSDLGVPYRTVSGYLGHLQTIFMIHLLPAWSRNLTAKVVHRPKLLIVDSGLAAHLLGVTPAGLDDPSAPAGPLLENFVAMELHKQLAWADSPANLSHFRDRGGAEVDLILERRDGLVAGIEVKASSTARSDDFRGLRLLRDRLGDRFAGGVVLYTGRQSVPFGERLLAAPIAALWEVTT